MSRKHAAPSFVVLKGPHGKVRMTAGELAQIYAHASGRFSYSWSWNVLLETYRSKLVRKVRIRRR